MLPAWYAPCLLKARIAKRESRRNKLGNVIQNAGWHLSYFGDYKFIKNKIEQFAHQEFNQLKFTNEDNIIKCIKTGKDLFERPFEKCIKISLSENKYLPPNHEFFNYLLGHDIK